MSLDRLDRTILEELVDLDPIEGLALVRDLVGIFFTEAPGRLDRIRCGLADGDADAVMRAAHAMRGAASQLGAVELADACARMERQARTRALTGLAAELDTIELELPNLGQRLEDHIAELARQVAEA